MKPRTYPWLVRIPKGLGVDELLLGIGSGHNQEGLPLKKFSQL